MNAAQLSRRAVIGILFGAGAVLMTDPLGKAIARWNTPPAPAAPSMAFPAWVRATPQSLQAYQAAFSNLELMATLPCFCGCDRMDLQHTSLRDCFALPDGRFERHGSVCGTCQGEAIDANALANLGVPWPEIRTQIVAAYGPRVTPPQRRVS